MKNDYLIFTKLIILTGFLYGLSSCNTIQKEKTSKEEKKQSVIWSTEKANKWSEKWGWLRGSNFQPSNAINQLEMFQAETFDTVTIDRELGWAEELGMNCMRVYLHHVLWKNDKEGFKKRIENYLKISWKHNIGTIFVFFDDCWNPEYKAGIQPLPEPGIHNSGWVQDPGNLIFKDSTLTETLEKYVKDILQTFGNDERIVLWDLYNEPGNSGWGDKSFPLLQKVFGWAREINPIQPLSSGVWKAEFIKFNKFQLENSDIITYHNYGNFENHKNMIDTLMNYKRPMICTEYMARTTGSRFEDIMPLLKDNEIGAINWGFVSGKTNTIYAWDTPVASGDEPEVWFHDILRKDGTPYSEDEVKIIKKLTGKTK